MIEIKYPLLHSLKDHIKCVIFIYYFFLVVLFRLHVFPLVLDPHPER